MEHPLAGPGGAVEKQQGYEVLVSPITRNMPERPNPALSPHAYGHSHSHGYGPSDTVTVMFSLFSTTPLGHFGTVSKRAQISLAAAGAKSPEPSPFCMRTSSNEIVICRVSVTVTVTGHLF